MLSYTESLIRNLLGSVNSPGSVPADSDIEYGYAQSLTGFNKNTKSKNTRRKKKECETRGRANLFYIRDCRKLFKENDISHKRGD